MNTGGSLRFLDFPFEIQQLILWKCLEGWKATVEIHEKAQEKSTTRLWSSVICDALMLSLTCKHLYKMIQDIQKDPRLFNGEIDLIEANAEVSYLVGIFTSSDGHFYIHQHDAVPRPLYRTQIFIKASPYDRSDPAWRMTRLKYHADARDWLTQNVRSLELWADEVTPRVPWERFPNLENITVYWPYTYFEVSDPCLRLCEHSKEQLVTMAKAPRNLTSAWDLRGVTSELERISNSGLQITVKYEVPHVHIPGETLDIYGFHEQYDMLVSADYYNLECTFIVSNRNWTQLSVVCHGELPMELDKDKRRRSAELIVARP